MGNKVNIDTKIQSDTLMNFVTLRQCVFKTLMIFLLSLIFVSCSPHKQFAYDFVKKSKGAHVAFYVPEELRKTNNRSDCDPNNIDLVLLDEDELRDTINSRVKILNDIDDEIFLEVMIASFEETLRDYDLSLEYWEDAHSKPDSMHWVVDVSHIEIQELIKYQVTSCGVNGNYEFLPSTTMNVAFWFELINDEKSHLLFSEQDYSEYIIDCYYTTDTANNIVVNAEFQRLSVDGFYDFAVMLGKLYAGYCYDFFMNDYVRKEMIKKEREYREDYMYLRYDPYESYIYGTYLDKLIKIEDK